MSLDDVANAHANTENDVSTMSSVATPSNSASSSADIDRTSAAESCPLERLPASTKGASQMPEPKRPSFVNYPGASRFGQPGLYYHGQRQPRGGGVPEPFDEWVCSPIECLAATHDERNDSHGLLLRFKPPYGPSRDWAMPMRLLRGSGEEIRGELLDMGVHLNPDAHKLLNRWLAQAMPDEKVVAATRIGWHTLDQGLAFVMPRQTIASGALANEVTFQSEFATQDDYATAGTLVSWRERIGMLCSGNPLLVLAVSTALVGPLLALTHRKSTGIHLVGDSSNGKTTALEVAASIWGGPDFVRTWRATGNGLEGVAAARCDTALILDEIGESDGREVGATIYALGNGTGKARASRNGTARQPHRWRIALLSSGERSLAAHMSESGQHPKAGQSVRLLDIPAKRQHGAFDHLHDHSGGRAFADQLKGEVTRHYGHVGPTFVQHLVSEKVDLAAELNGLVQAPGFTSAHPLHGRAAEALALIALAGELATRFGLTGWKEGESLQAAIGAFQAWKTGHGTVQSEHEQILARVRGFIERHGDARFSPICDDPPPVRDRAGWWREGDGGRVYLFNTEGMREALDGFDVRRGLDALEAAGWIIDRDSGSRSVRLQHQGSRGRYYAIRPSEGEEAQ